MIEFTPLFDIVDYAIEQFRKFTQDVFNFNIFWIIFVIKMGSVNTAARTVFRYIAFGDFVQRKIDLTPTVWMG